MGVVVAPPPINKASQYNPLDPLKWVQTSIPQYSTQSYALDSMRPSRSFFFIFLHIVIVFVRFCVLHCVVPPKTSPKIAVANMIYQTAEQPRLSGREDHILSFSYTLIHLSLPNKYEGPHLTAIAQHFSVFNGCFSAWCLVFYLLRSPVIWTPNYSGAP